MKNFQRFLKIKKENKLKIQIKKKNNWFIKKRKKLILK